MSAADVVLYGVNLILPLMSQDLLKVIEDSECENPNRLLGVQRCCRQEYTSDLIKEV